MRKFDWACLALLAACSATYIVGELWARDYIDNIELERAKHGFNRVLIIAGAPAEQAPRADTRKLPASDSNGFAGGRDATQLLSANALEWMESRSFVQSISTWTVQLWAAQAGEVDLPSLYIYGIGEADVANFELGVSSGISKGDVVLAESGAEAFGGDELPQDIRLSVPTLILRQLPSETAEVIRQTSRVVIPLSQDVLANPPGLRPGRRVAYVARDASHISGVVRPATIYLVKLHDEAGIPDAKAEIGDYLERFERPSTLGVRAVVRSVDEYFPPVISVADLSRLLLWIRMLLVLMFLAAGFGVAWMKLREHAFEMALRTALGSRPRVAFLMVYGSWLGRLFLAAVAGALLGSLASVTIGGASSVVASWAILLIALFGLGVGTLMVAQRTLRAEPLRVLARESQ